MSTVTPVTFGSKGGASLDAERKVGMRIGAHLRLDRMLERTDAWALYLGDNEQTSELVLVVVATSSDALEHALSSSAKGRLLQRSTFETFHVAEVALDDEHYVRFGEHLLAGGQGSSDNSTLESTSYSSGEGLVLGTDFAGRYQVEEVLGRGGMGEVYRAYDKTFARSIALKVLRVDSSTGSPEHREEAKRRLLNEARVVSALKHPHIVEVYDAGQCDGLPYLVLELCEGGNLRQALTTKATQAEKLKWIVEMAEALAHAHDRGIIHRDVKPENVILTKDRTVKVTDFGIAKALERGDRENVVFSVIGTPQYMAPEQHAGIGVDARADQYAWGLVAYELLTGSHRKMRELDSHRHETPSTSSANVPPHLRRILERAMANSPLSRYDDFHEILARLQPRRSRSRIIGAIVAAVLLLSGGLFARSLMPKPSTVTAAPSSSPSDAVAVFDTERTDAETILRCAPPARRSLAAGLQLWRDASHWDAVPKFDEASTLDPECVPARVYYILAAAYTVPRRREHFRLAREQRIHLNERERAILDALEPSIADEPDYEEMRRRAAIIAERDPSDPDVQRIHSRALFRLGRLDDALSVLDRVSSLHAHPIAGNENLAAQIEIRRRDAVAAHKRFDQCLRASPDSGDCLVWKGLLLASQGECRSAESTFRHLTSVMPGSAAAYDNLGNVLLAETRDPGIARGAFEERWRHLSNNGYGTDATPAAARAADEYRMAVMSGDLETGLRYARRWNDAVATSNNGRYRGDPLLELVALLRELGQNDEARRLAVQGLKEQRTWSTDDYLDTNIEFARAAYVTGGIDSTEYRKLRQEWEGRRKPTPIETWLGGFAGLPVELADMAPPVAPDEYAQDWISMSPQSFGRAAVDLTRVGRHADAIRHADAAAANCLAFTPMATLHAQLVAATAHEAAGDISNACSRYKALRGQLARNRRSHTLQLVKSRIEELSCKGAP